MWGGCQNYEAGLLCWGIHLGPTTVTERQPHTWGTLGDEELPEEKAEGQRTLRAQERQSLRASERNCGCSEVHWRSYELLSQGPW